MPLTNAIVIIFLIGLAVWGFWLLYKLDKEGE